MHHEHDHKFVTVKKELVAVEDIKDDRALFEFIEYAYLLCKCNDIIKIRVKNQERPSGKKITGDN